MKEKKGEAIYLDYNATTPIDPKAVEAMLPYLSGEFGNPSSAYELGKSARDGIERARESVAVLMGANRNEIVFTSGGTESNNMVIKGLIDFRHPERHHIVTSAIEHPAVLNPVLYLMELGVNVTVVPVDQFCRIDPETLRKAITPQTTLITIMLANNETGTLQPVREITKIGKDYGVPVHTDAAQAVGKIHVDVNELGVDFLTLAGHKVYGPKGIGALFIREGRHLIPLIHGAGQEYGRRPGTENTIFAVGLGTAAEIARKRLEEDYRHCTLLRDRLQKSLFNGLIGLVLNGHDKKRLPNTLNISVPGIEGERILDGLINVMASTGAACHDRSVKLSHVLTAMGVSPEIGMGALRLTVGRSNTMEQIEEASQLIISQIKLLRKQ